LIWVRFQLEDSIEFLTLTGRRFMVLRQHLPQEECMRASRLLPIAGLLFSACSSTEWVHPNKPSSEYITDYNRCQNQVLRDPKLQQGSQLMILNATERCVQKEGWRLVENQ
jgi:hypothetical protein